MDEYMRYVSYKVVNHVSPLSALQKNAGRCRGATRRTRLQAAGRRRSRAGERKKSFPWDNHRKNYGESQS